MWTSIWQEIKKDAKNDQMDFQIKADDTSMTKEDVQLLNCKREMDIYIHILLDIQKRSVKILKDFLRSEKKMNLSYWIYKTDLLKHLWETVQKDDKKLSYGMLFEGVKN